MLDISCGKRVHEEQSAWPLDIGLYSIHPIVVHSGNLWDRTILVGRWLHREAAECTENSAK